VNIAIIHGGQTGVDRGAHRVAIEYGWKVGGCMPKSGRDELGDIPADVAAYLRRCVTGGMRDRTEVNIDLAEALLVIVPDKQDPYATPGTALTLKLARDRKLPRLVVEPADPPIETVRWLGLLRQRLGNGHATRIMVAGPRASRWLDGEREAAGFLRRMWQHMLDVA